MSMQRRPFRSSNGRFRSNLETIGQNQSSEFGGIRKRRQRNMALFEGYVKVFFLTGDEKDFIPFSSKNGPFVEVFEKIIKSSYQLGRTTRSSKLQEFYKDQCRQKIPTEIARITLRDARSQNGSGFRRDVYRYRRFPNISNRTEEIEPLKAWLRQLEIQNALSMPFNSAYAICCAAMGSYVTVSGKRAYIGYPGVQKEDKSASCNNTRMDERNQSLEGSGSTVRSADHSSCEINETISDVNVVIGGDRNRQETGLNQIEARTESGVRHVEAPSAHPHEDETGLPAIRNNPSPRSARNFRRASSILNIARCNKTFEFLSKVLDDENSKFHLLSGPFITPSIGEPKIPVLLKHILLHGQGKAFEFQNTEELQKVEQKLREVRDFLHRIREIYALKRLEDMNWTFG